MSVIQKIRDKYARWAVIAIAVSLLGFILMDAFAGRTGLFSNRQSNALGKINGNSIDAQLFAMNVSEIEANDAKQGQQYGDDRHQQIVNGLWQQKVDSIVLSRQYDELGLTVSDKELKDIMYGANPPEDLKRSFTDPKTGIFNAVAAQQQVNSIKKSGSPEQKLSIQRFEENLRAEHLMSKYMALLANTIYYPKWFLERRNADNSYLAKASYVAIPYATVPDSTVKVTDKEIEDYIKEHKKDFEQKEETRSVSYVAFSAAPSAADSAALRSQLESLKQPFAATNDPKTFISNNGGGSDYFDGYLGKSTIKIPMKDSVLAIAKGAVYGPYLDAGNYTLAKMIDIKTLPDSAKARHILIQTNNPQTGQVLLPDSIAKKRIDSIKTAIDHGARFDSLAKKYSDDKGSGEKGGLLSTPNTDYFPQGQMVKAFNDFVFDGKPGARDVVKTEFGYHLVEVLDQKNIEPHYKIAYLTKPIEAGQETENAASNQASLFAGDSRDLKSFNANFDKNLRSKGFNKVIANDIKPMDFTVTGMQGASREMRPFIKNIFTADKGDVIGPEKIGQNYIVAIVTDIEKPGPESADKARSRVEPILRNKKKGQQIIKNIGQVTTLEQVSGKVNQSIQTADSLRFSGGNSALGYEPKVLGAIFNPNNKGKVISEPLAGTQGIYVVRVDNITTTPVEGASIEDQRKMLEMQTRQGMQYRSPIEVLRKTADIKDNRSKFY